MRKYKGLTRIGFKTGLAYRFDFLVSLVTTPISIIVFYFLWKSIYAYTGEEVIRGFTFQVMISYYVLNMIVAFFTWSNVERLIENDVVYGDMIFRLLSPVTYFSNLYFFEFGVNLLAILLEAIPILIIGFVFFAVQTTTLTNVIFFITSMLLASLLYFLISYLIGLTAFWFKRIDGLSRAKRPIVSFLGGGMIPLAFFPLSIQKVLDWLPFQYIRHVPISIYLGRFTITTTIKLLLVQIVWIIILFVLAKLLWTKAFKKFAGAGA